jgi:hypothetical protein
MADLLIEEIGVLAKAVGARLSGPPAGVAEGSGRVARVSSG